MSNCDTLLPSHFSCFNLIVCFTMYAPFENCLMVGKFKNVNMDSFLGPTFITFLYMFTIDGNNLSLNTRFDNLAIGRDVVILSLIFLNRKF